MKTKNRLNKSRTSRYASGPGGAAGWISWERLLSMGWEAGVKDKKWTEEMYIKDTRQREKERGNEQLLSCWTRWLGGRMRERLGVVTPRALWAHKSSDAKQLSADRAALHGQHQVWRQHKLQGTASQTLRVPLLYATAWQKNSHIGIQSNMLHRTRPISSSLWTPPPEREFNCNEFWRHNRVVQRTKSSSKADWV